MIQSKVRLATTLGAFLLATAAWGHAHHDHSQLTGVVRERMDAMAEMGRRMASITKRVGERELVASVRGDAVIVKELAANIIPLFPSGSLQSGTEATAAIWKNFKDFESKAKVLEVEAAKLAIEELDAPALSRQLSVVREACSSCHQKYRIKQ